MKKPKKQQTKKLNLIAPQKRTQRTACFKISFTALKYVMQTGFAYVYNEYKD